MGSHHRWESPGLPWTAGLEQGTVALSPLAQQRGTRLETPALISPSSLLPHLRRALKSCDSQWQWIWKRREWERY